MQNDTLLTGKVEDLAVPDELHARKLAWRLIFGFALIYLAFLPPGVYSIDGNSMLSVAESLVTRHSVAVTTTDLGAVGPDGNIYSKWYPLLSFLAIPVVAAAVPISHNFHVPMHYVAGVLAGVLPALLTAGTVGLVALINSCQRKNRAQERTPRSTLTVV